MSKGSAGPHLGGHPDRLHQFLRGGAGPLSGLGVPLDAIGALGDMGDGNGNQLLRLGVESTIGEHLAAERIERRLGVGRKSRRLCASSGDGSG